MKNIFLTAAVLALFASFCFADVKECDLAGSWYPASKDGLSNMLKGYLDKAGNVKVEGEIIGLISPHAGYRYSGPVAAYGFKSIQGKNIKTAIIIGFNHRFYHNGIAVCDFDFYKTPLGEVEIDKELSNELIAQHGKIYSLKRAFYDENSTEMQIPFLQFVLSDFKIVIIQMGDQSLENCEILSNALYNVLKKRKNFILIASTDLSHFLPYNKAEEVDKDTISFIEKFQPIELYTESSLKDHSLMCGYGAVCATLMASKLLGANDIDILRYANSGDETFDKRRVVGYLSAAINKSPSHQVTKSPSHK